MVLPVLCGAGIAFALYCLWSQSPTTLVWTGVEFPVLFREDTGELTVVGDPQVMHQEFECIDLFNEHFWGWDRVGRRFRQTQNGLYRQPTADWAEIDGAIAAAPGTLSDEVLTWRQTYGPDPLSP